MQTEQGTCTKCLTPNVPIVNRKRQYCDDCNYKRLHNGKSKQEVYSERKRTRDKETPKPNKNRRVTTPLNNTKSKEDIDSLKKKYSIKNVSKTNKYTCSDGEQVTQSQINSRYAATCDAIKLEREPFCQGTGRTDLPLSFSHTISRARCKQLGKIELIWDPGNIEIESYHEPSSNPEAAHNIYESGTWEKKVELLNWQGKMEYIYNHDREQYLRIALELQPRGLEEHLWVGAPLSSL